LWIWGEIFRGPALTDVRDAAVIDYGVMDLCAASSMESLIMFSCAGSIVLSAGV
jgi:hypothetical protein